MSLAVSSHRLACLAVVQMESGGSQLGALAREASRVPCMAGPAARGVRAFWFCFLTVFVPPNTCRNTYLLFCLAAHISVHLHAGSPTLHSLRHTSHSHTSQRRSETNYEKSHNRSALLDPLASTLF